jgi:hypothetical protein
VGGSNATYPLDKPAASPLRTAKALSRYASRKSGPYSQSNTVDADGAFVRVDQMAEETAAQGALVVGATGGLGGAILRRLAKDRPDAPMWITYPDDVEAAAALAASVPGARTAQCDLRRKLCR